MPDSTVRVKVVPEIDEEALLAAVLKVIEGHAVVRPGETLVIRVADWNPEQVEYYQEDLDTRGLPFRVLVVIGDELAVARPEPETTVSAPINGDLHAAMALGHAFARQSRGIRMTGRDPLA